MVYSLFTPIFGFVFVSMTHSQHVCWGCKVGTVWCNFVVILLFVVLYIHFPHVQLVREEVEAGQRVTNLESKVDKLQKQMTALVTLFNDKSAWDVNGDMKSTVTLPDVLTNLFMGTPTKSAMKKMHAELNVEKTV